MNIDEIFNALSAPFPTECVQWRIGSTNAQWRKETDPLTCKALAYIDARAVMDRLDSVMGFENWQCNYTPGVGPSIVCNIGLRINGEAFYETRPWKIYGEGPNQVKAGSFQGHSISKLSPKEIRFTRARDQEMPSSTDQITLDLYCDGLL